MPTSLAGPPATGGGRASTSGLNPELTAGLVAEVRRGAPARSRGTRWGKVGEGSKSTKLSEVARAPPPGGKGGLAGLWEGRCGGGGDAQLLSPPPPGPHSPAPKWEDDSCPLPPPDTPATCPVPQRSVRRLRARGAEPVTLQPRGGREPASGAPLVGD